MINYALKGSSLCVSGSASEKNEASGLCIRNTSGFYLSESALKDLELIPHNFPSQTSKIDASALVNGKASCGCSQRTTVPDKPANISFPPIASNRGHLNYGYGNISNQVHLTLVHINRYK